MFSWELLNFLNERNDNITHSEYCYMVATSPQITNIKYEGTYNDDSGKYKMWTKDNYYFEFKVKKFYK